MTCAIKSIIGPFWGEKDQRMKPSSGGICFGMRAEGLVQDRFNHE